MGNDDDDEGSSAGSADCLRDLLGGLSPDDIPAAAWENPQVDDHSEKKSEAAATASDDCTRNRKQTSTAISCPKYTLSDDEECASIFSRAYSCSGYCTPNGKVDRPPLQMVDMEGRGHGLLATRDIAKGEVIYTEKAFIATQILPGETLEQDDGEDNSILTSSAAAHYSVRACQNCFRSMEPVTKCSRVANPDHDNSDEATSSNHKEGPDLLPLPHLWPVPAFDDNISNSADAEAIDGTCISNNDDDKADCRCIKHDTSDPYGRVHCNQCSSWFCSSFCRTQFNEAFGDCCLVHKAAVTVRVRPFQQEAAAIAWATRMFLHDLQRYRQNDGDNPRVPSPIVGLCGSKDDLKALDIGILTSEASNAHHHTIRPIYENLVKLLCLSQKEQEILSLNHLEDLTCKAARNGIAVRTQSPFKSYHAALLRNSGGRGSEKHLHYLQDIARVLSSSRARAATEENSVEGPAAPKLTRQMDRQLDSLLAPEVAAIFLLTARLNHSCDPNAQVVNQEFIDAHIDLVATKDIRRGEEVTISYIPVNNTNGASSTARRQRELAAKYLFHCDCPKCAS